MQKFISPPPHLPKNFYNIGHRSLNSTNFGYFRTEIKDGDDNEEPHIKFFSRDGLSKAILKIEDAVE